MDNYIGKLRGWWTAARMAWCRRRNRNAWTYEVTKAMPGWVGELSGSLLVVQLKLDMIIRRLDNCQGSCCGSPKKTTRKKRAAR